MTRNDKIDLQYLYVEKMGGIKLDLRTFEGKRYLRNICRMPAPTSGISKELGFLTINDWATMLDYIEEHNQ